uniref:histidine kinase n=1 Tax=Thermosporothrix sp. COM3 TaxID=2490863 RepID=A0A455SU70_9CHLR|nr:hypothetical protein KTC_59270 [Thermosporothrix sp. COM3]
MSNTFDKLSILDSFIEEVNSYLPEIEANLERLAQSPGDMDALEETYRRTHTIGGSASMMDFPGLAHVAHGMEDILGDALDGLASLDEPTLGLLRRSLGRLYRLVEGIRSGVNEEAIVAEDDEDYAQYRAMMDAAEGGNPPQATSQAQTMDVPASPAPFGTEGMAPYSSLPAQNFDFSAFTQTQNAFSPALSSTPSMPSLDEMVEAFRTPSLSAGEDIAWPEDLVPPGEEPEPVPQSNDWNESSSSQLPSSSALEALISSSSIGEVPEAQKPASQDAFSLLTSSGFHEPQTQHNASGQQQGYDIFSSLAATPQPSPQPPLPVPQEPQLPQAYHTVRNDIQTLENQLVTLKDLVSQVRSAISVVEDQRTEFRSFLDGSKDALERMEDWAGRAMGLNLRNSPEKVRRYLPLSVMWVSNSKLKKVLEVLKQIAARIEGSDSQLLETIQQVQESLATCEAEILQMQVPAQPSASLSETGWSPWEMQVSQDQAQLRQRVTFERQGDPAAIRAEVEAQLREEMRREIEAVQAQAQSQIEEVARRVREETLREVETKETAKARAFAGSMDQEALRELERRLRSEIEIQVRQEFLNQISHSGSISDMPQSLTKNDAGAIALNFGVGNTSTQQVPTNLQAPKVQPPEPAKQNPMGGDFGEEAAEIFRMEAEEHLQTISARTAALEKDPGNLELIQAIRRATHTLKGAAGMMGFRPIADLSHISEDLLDSIMERTTPITPQVLGIILDTTEALDMLINGRGEGASNPEGLVQKMRARYTQLLGEHSVAAIGPAPDMDIDEEDEHPNAHPNAPHVSSVVEGGAKAEGQVASRDLNVRVRLQKLDELVNLFGDLLVNRSVLEERIQRLARLVADASVSSNRLNDIGQRLGTSFEAVMLPSGRSVKVVSNNGEQSLILTNEKTEQQEPAHLADFDELELDRYTEFHQLTRGLSESISDMATLSAEMEAIIRECENVFARENRLSTTFQDRLMKVRLVPLSTMTPRLYRAARVVALKQGKDFDFDLEGNETEVDRTVFEEIVGPLEHLMRNAVNHGLEAPDIRALKGKSPKGQIKLSAGYEGNQVVITIRDDGNGIDPERVRQIAIERGLIRPEQVLSESDVVSLIFQPGFSTAEVLSEVSGRGVGLDVVRDAVSRLRGTLEVETTPGQGTAFTMKFPTSLAIQNAMMVRIGTQQFAIPTLVVEAIGRLDSFKRTVVDQQPAVLIQDQHYPLRMLAQYLGLPIGQLDEKSQLLIVHAGGHHVALVVDEIKGRYDIVMKSLGPHLRNVHGVAGATVLGNGQVVLVLELNDLLSTRERTKLVANITGNQQGAMRQYVDTAGRPTTAAMRPSPTSPAAADRGRHILVVDDSPSVRRVVSNMLKQNGWEVQTARDGVEALEMISYETPAAVLLDIEMPRMDGYELIATVRAQEQYRSLPLVVLTSRAAAKHQQRAMQLGASAYVIKPYQDEDLLNTLSSLVYGTSSR